MSVKEMQHAMALATVKGLLFKILKANLIITAYLCELHELCSTCNTYAPKTHCNLQSIASPTVFDLPLEWEELFLSG